MLLSALCDSVVNKRYNRDMNLKILFISCFFVFSQIALGQGKNHTSLNHQINQHFKTFYKNTAAPGFSVVLVKGEKILFSKGYGIEKVGSDRAMTSQTVTAIGSLTKSITAMAIMQLVEQNLLKLDDPVTKYLPEFRTANKELSDKITVRMLINNTSGLYGGVSKNSEDTEQSLELLMTSLESVYLTREPGSSYEYSNVAFSLAGLIISRVSGMSYPEYLKKNIFQPLEMKHSTTDPDDFDKLNVLYGHHLGINKGIPAKKGIESGEMAPAGSLLRSNADDLGHYLIMLLNNGNYNGKQLISQKSMNELWTKQINFPGLNHDQGGDGKEFHYGLGWMISEVEGRTIINHGGSRSTMSSMTILDPEKQIAASILFNVDYNFVDKYRFQSEFNLLNNLFHLIEKEELTDFGNPRIPDPTINDYVLPNSLKQKIIGEYRYAGGENGSSFQGMNLEIFSSQNGELEARGIQRDELLLQFSIDFINEANALSRNLGSAKSIHLKIRPDGLVTGLFYSGSEFKKLSPDFREKYQLLKFEDLSVSFFFPKSWTITKQDNQFSAYKESDSSISILAGFDLNNIQNHKEALKNSHHDTHILYEGVEMTEVRGRFLWSIKAFTSDRNGAKSQHLVLLNDSGAKGFYLILSTPFGDLTKEMQDVIEVLMDSFIVDNL